MCGRTACPSYAVCKYDSHGKRYRCICKAGVLRQGCEGKHSNKAKKTNKQISKTIEERNKIDRQATKTSMIGKQKNRNRLQSGKQASKQTNKQTNEQVQCRLQMSPLAYTRLGLNFRNYIILF